MPHSDPVSYRPRKSELQRQRRGSDARACQSCGTSVPRRFRWCDSCTKARRSAHAVHSNRKRLYGVDRPTFESMLEEQGGLCAICGVDAASSVDHDHQTGRVRALLCGRCNTGIGQFRENAAFLQSAIQYLLKHKGPI